MNTRSNPVARYYVPQRGFMAFLRFFLNVQAVSAMTFLILACLGHKPSSNRVDLILKKNAVGPIFIWHRHMSHEYRGDALQASASSSSIADRGYYAAVDHCNCYIIIITQCCVAALAARINARGKEWTSGQMPSMTMTQWRSQTLNESVEELMPWIYLQQSGAIHQRRCPKH